MAGETPEPSVFFLDVGFCRCWNRSADVDPLLGGLDFGDDDVVDENLCSIFDPFTATVG